MIDMSDRARQQLLALGVGNGAFVRLKVRPGGCAGMTYDVEVDRVLALGEVEVFDDGIVKVVSEPDSLHLLEGLQIDYSDDLISAGFRFSNPANQSSCGCGASFALADLPVISGGGCGR